MAQWYYVQNGQQAGPVEAGQLMQMLASGALNAADLIWKDGMANWVAAGSVPELWQPVAAPAWHAPQAPAFAPMPYPAQSPVAQFYAPPPGRQTQSKLGVASFVIGIIVGLMEVVSIVYATAEVMQRPNRNASGDPGMIMAGLMMIGGIILAVVGVILGFISLSQKQNRTLGILGTIINGGILLLVGALLIIGFAARK